MNRSTLLVDEKLFAEALHTVSSLQGGFCPPNHTHPIMIIILICHHICQNGPDIAAITNEVHSLSRDENQQSYQVLQDGQDAG